jgi:hypothetical protein
MLVVSLPDEKAPGLVGAFCLGIAQASLQSMNSLRARCCSGLNSASCGGGVSVRRCMASLSIWLQRTFRSVNHHHAVKARDPDQHATSWGGASTLLGASA